MRWTYTIKNKFLASAVLLTLCLLVLLSNYLDRMRADHVKSSIVTLYEDRLIADDYILKMTNDIYKIREILNTDSSNVSKSNMVGKLTDDFNDWYNIYMKTKLTPTEKKTAVELIGYIRDFENNISSSNYSPSDYTDKALLLLNKLSAIQLEESKLIMTDIESEYAAIKLTSQFAFGIVIIILLVLQALVFSAKALVKVKPKDPTLN